MPARRTRRYSSRSSGLASTTSTRNGSGACSVGRWEDDHIEPVVPERAQRTLESREVERLLDVTVGARPVALADVALIARGGHHHHRDLAHLRVALDAREHLPAVRPWEVEVEQDEPRIAPTPASGPRVEEIGERLVTIGQVHDGIVEPRLDERASRGLEVLGAVLDDEQLARDRLTRQAIPPLEIAG